jgi:transposase
MRFYNQQHRFYCGVDLHARSMFTHILDHGGKTVFERDLPAGPDAFRDAVAPFRDGLVVGCECMFAWYWLADLCEDESIPFTLGHALYMKAIHGGKSKNDRIDAAKIAGLLRGGRKIGNAHLKWAFSEAAVLMLRSCAPVKAWLARQEKKRGKRKALAILEAKLGRAVYQVWRKQTPFDAKKFLAH